MQLAAAMPQAATNGQSPAETSIYAASGMPAPYINGGKLRFQQTIFPSLRCDAHKCHEHHSGQRVPKLFSIRHLVPVFENLMKYNNNNNNNVYNFNRSCRPVVV